MIDADGASDGLFSQMDLFADACCASPARRGAIPTDRYIDGVDQTSFLLAGDGDSNRKYHYYWLGQRRSRPCASASTSSCSRRRRTTTATC